METQLISKKLHDLIDKDRESCCLYSLSHKCKKWADSEYYYISSVYRFNKSSGSTVFSKTHNDYKKFSADSEPEAVFQACEWILKENKMKCAIEETKQMLENLWQDIDGNTPFYDVKDKMAELVTHQLYMPKEETYKFVKEWFDNRH